MSKNILFFAAALAALLAATIGLGCSSCGKQNEQAQKSPEDAEDEAKFKLSPAEIDALPSEDSVWKSMFVPHRVAAALISQDHVFKSKVTHAIDRKTVKPEEPKEEIINVITASEISEVKWRASDGAFTVMFRPEESSMSLDLIWLDKLVYTRFGEAAWKKDVSTGIHNFYLEKATTSLERFYRLYRGRLSFAKAGKEKFLGRDVIKIKITLDKAGHEVPAELPLTTKTGDKYRINLRVMNKDIEDKRSTMAGWDKAEGELYIDAKTGVPLKGKISSVCSMNTKENWTAVLKMDYEFEWELPTQKIEISPPGKDEIVDQDERKKFVPNEPFKEMPKELQEKSGVNQPRKILPDNLLPQNQQNNAGSQQGQQPSNPADKPKSDAKPNNQPKP